jgi:hypothetical protein
MVSLGVIAVYLFPGLTDLLDNEELRFGFDDPFDLRLFVSRDDNEAVTLAHDSCIACGWDTIVSKQEDRPHSPWRQWRGDCMLLRASLNPLIHTAKDLLVSRSPFSEVHRRGPPLQLAEATACSTGCVPSAAALFPLPDPGRVLQSVVARDRSGDQPRHQFGLCVDRSRYLGRGAAAALCPAAAH